MCAVNCFTFCNYCNFKIVEEEARLSEHHDKSSSEMVSFKKPTLGKPKIKKPMPKPRPMSCSLGRPLKKENPAIREDMVKSPFVAYGFWDQEKETGKKRTHNIRASCQVW